MRRRTLTAASAAALTLSLCSAAALGQADRATELPLARQPDGSLPLEGTPWRLEAYRHAGRDAVPGPEVAASLRLDGGRIVASGGCSRIRGRYTTLGAGISFELGQLKPPTCAEQTTLVQLAMASGLAKAAAWERVPGPEGSGDRLVLRATSGEELLRFGLDDVAALEGSTWTLDSYTVGGEKRAASGQQSALLRFVPEQSSAVRRRSKGQVTGSSGCNGIVGSYARDADVLSFGRLQVTDAPCTPELASQEAAMTGVLDATALILGLGYDRLTLTVPETGDSLAFVSARPLEGSTWMLRGAYDLALDGARITLRLADGIASGEGPCGAYAATYSTDGVFITIRDVQGARDEACASAAAEKAMLEALRDAARVERNGQRLRLRDVRGQVLLAFELPGVG